MKANIPFWTIESVFDNLSITNPHPRNLLTELLQTHPCFSQVREQYDNRDAAWLFAGIQAINDAMPQWIVSGRKRKEEWLKYYRRLCLLLLEDSDFLLNMPTDRQETYRSKLSSLIVQCDHLLQVLHIYKEGNSAAYLHETTEKLSRSGYLYRAAIRLKMLSWLLLMDDADAMTQEMDYLLHIIITGNHELWHAEPLGSAVRRLIDTYIEKECALAERAGGTENGRTQKRIRRIITAITVELMLAGNEKLAEMALPRAMFYRYLTHIKGSKPDVLLDKAFYCLTAERQFPLEFGWEDLETKEHTLLALKMSHPYPVGGRQSWRSQQYTGKNGQIRLLNGTLELFPAVAKGVKYLPDYLIPWNKCLIRLPALPHGIPPETNRDMTAYQTLWKDTENLLAANEASTGNLRRGRQKQRQPAEKDDVVLIRILYASSPDTLLCRIEDPLYYGEGTLPVRNVVRYRTHANAEVFRDENNRSYLLQAQVQGVDKLGMCTFSLLGFVDRFIGMSVDVGETVVCRVMDAFPGSSYITCLSDYGYSVFLSRKDEMPDLQPGDYIEAEVTDVRSTGYITGRFKQTAVASFNADDAFANLVLSYALRNAQYGSEEPVEEEPHGLIGEEIPADHLQELIRIIDRRSAQKKDDCIQSYNLLSFARLMAVLTGRDRLASEMSKRLKIIYLLQQFVLNGMIDRAKLAEVGEDDPERLNSHAQLPTPLVELHLLNCMNKPDRNGQLWEVMHATENKQIERLAQYVMARNLLKACNISVEQEEVSKRLIELLDMGIRLPQLYNFGSEDQHTEFKTSIVYPAGKSNVPDLNAQTDEILRVICGFLNADGGTLYLGVNNDGYASGLQSDLPYFDDSRDKFDLHVRNHIAQNLGLKANSLISVFYPEAGSKWVYALSIQPCDTPVLFKEVCYQRQGSSTWALSDSVYKGFCLLRNSEPLPDPGAGTEAAPAAVVPLVAPASATPAPPVTPASAVAPASAVETEEAKTGIQTSQLRKNPVHSYEDGYGIEAMAYLHYLTGNRYMITDDESWRNDVECSLVITEPECDGYLVQVYEDGTMIKCPIRNILDKAFSREYKRYAQKKLFWTAPMRKGDMLLSVVIDANNRPAFRLDDIADIKEGTMLVQGSPLTHAELKKVVQFEIIPPDRQKLFEKICGQRETQAGVNLLTDWGQQEMRNFEKMGIKIAI
ncbi:MAG: ATP-binding protein [Prevotellaceae bacterium]|jgi:hypothetical protein|nr:ATP-binding protein [Prevotellaceae bacterium]